MPLLNIGAVGTTTSDIGIVTNSLRFNGGSSDYLNRTIGSPTNDKIGTISLWLKNSGNTSNKNSFISSFVDGNNECKIYFDSSTHQLVFVEVSGGGILLNFKTSQVFRDMSAWYHILISIDTTQSTSTDRLKFYVNGNQITSFATSSYPSQNASIGIFTNTRSLDVGRHSSEYFDGYMAEVVFIDGQALTPTSFGEFDSDTNIWKPIDVSGLTFGNNGFYLDFENSVSLGNDKSGNGNNFTVNNLTSVDQSVDIPINNFCTLNSISEHNDSTFSDGNLTYTGNASAVHNAIGSIGVTQGKWYFEAKRVTGNSAYPFAGVFNADGSMGSYLGATSDGWTILMDASDNGEWRNNGTLSGTSAGTFSNGNIAMIAIDMDNGKIWFGKDGTWAASGNPSAGSGEQYSNLTGTIVPAVAVYTGASVSLNFGSPPYSISSGNSDANNHGNFEYAVPTGFYSLNTKNLAEFG